MWRVYVSDTRRRRSGGSRTNECNVQGVWELLAILYYRKPKLKLKAMYDTCHTNQSNFPLWLGSAK